MSIPSYPQLGQSTISDEAATAFSALLADRFTTALGVREQYGKGEAFAILMPPDAVAFPTSTKEVACLVAICRAHRIPMVTSGACTSLEGHIAAVRGGLAINLAHMNRIAEINGGDLECMVEAGVTREQLNHELRNLGLFFPIDPGANATIGGMAATRASGTNAVRYGTMLNNVMGLTVVQPDGSVIKTGGRARKSSAGYDLTRLYVGSEGTLGIITEVRLKLYGIPESITAATCAFEDIAGAVTTVTEMVQVGIAVARVELLDAVQMVASNRYSGLSMPERPHLFFEFHGSPTATAEQAQLTAEIAANNGGADFEWASSSEDRNRLWKARHAALYAARALRPGADVWSTDLCVPVTNMPDAIVAAREDVDRHGLTASIVGHVGDGNFHILFVLDPNQPEERATAESVYDRAIARALTAGGSCTGEHGVGLVKREHIVEEHGEGAIATMKAIKRALDPDHLMNPGKIFAEL